MGGVIFLIAYSDNIKMIRVWNRIGTILENGVKNARSFFEISNPLSSDHGNIGNSLITYEFNQKYSVEISYL